MGKVSITPEQRKEWERFGKKKLEKQIISGFQLEDFDPNNKEGLYYGHSSPRHISIMKLNIGGKKYPRESIYKWDKDWDLGENTVLIDNEKYAKETGQYIHTKKINQADRFIRTRALAKNPNVKNPIYKSWEVPDVRLFGQPKQKEGYKKAYLVTKDIDRNSRFATIITRKSKLDKLRRKMRGEKIQKIHIQDYKPKDKHSLFEFIEGVYSHWKKKR